MIFEVIASPGCQLEPFKSGVSLGVLKTKLVLELPAPALITSCKNKNIRGCIVKNFKGTQNLYSAVKMCTKVGVFIYEDSCCNNP